MRVICISDTHGKHRDLKLEKCDILIHCGDMNINCLNDLLDIDIN